MGIFPMDASDPMTRDDLEQLSKEELVDLLMKMDDRHRIKIDEYMMDTVCDSLDVSFEEAVEANVWTSMHTLARSVQEHKHAVGIFLMALRRGAPRLYDATAIDDMDRWYHEVPANVVDGMLRAFGYRYED